MKKNSLPKEIAIDAGPSALGAGIGIAIGGPVGGILGAIIGPTLTDVLKRHLSQSEKERIEIVARIAINKISETLRKGGKPTHTNASSLKAQELFEGTLLKAKETYEQKKLPLLANLFACAPFTNTPLENLNQALIFAEQLSYQQLCILALMGNSIVGKEPGLGKEQFSNQYKDKSDERTVGIYQDIVYMRQIGIIAQKSPGADYLDAALGGGLGDIIPNNLVLLGTGTLIFNTLQLDSIDEKDLEVIKKALV